jgi:hypothetical protein
VTTKLAVAVIVDNDSISEWQARALIAATQEIDIQLVLNCTNTRTTKKIVKNFAYYALNVISLRSALTRKTSMPDGSYETIAFDADYNGIWQSIPCDVADRIRARNIRLVIKFGMGLLRIDDHLADIDVLSFHHGDPQFYRGRPAGFYELYDNADRIGMIVQKLSNVLDGGEVLAKAYCKIYRHSYRRTAANLYLNSQFLLRKAVLNYRQSDSVPMNTLGKLYTLPSNWAVLIFVLKLLKRKLGRLAYGAFVEKRWNIVRFDGVNDITSISTLSVRRGYIPAVDRRYSFYADPFFSTDGKKIRVEALNAVTGLGEIIELDRDSLCVCGRLLIGSHYSYPQSFSIDGCEYLVPEVASHSHPVAFKLPLSHRSSVALTGLEGENLVDATLAHHDDHFYLFGTVSGSADCLHLFVAHNLTGPYVRHPASPIVIDPKCARMAGRICVLNGKSFRIGQNNCYGYGKAVCLSEILEWSATTYSERLLKELRFDDANGPHTIDISDGSVVLDHYVEAFSLLAGYRRLAPKFLQHCALGTNRHKSFAVAGQ